MRQRPRLGVWLVLVLTVIVLSGLAMFSRPTYADEPVRFKPRLDQVEEPALPPPGQHQSGPAGPGGGDNHSVESPSPWSWGWKIGLFAALAGVGVPMTSLLRREVRGPKIDWSKVKDFTWGVVKGIAKAAGAILAVIALAALAVVAGVPAAVVTTVLLVVAAVLVTIGAGFSIYHRWKEQQAAGIKHNAWKTTGVGLLDALGISSLVEGMMGRRLLTGEALDPEVAGESFGSGLVQVVALGIGARTFPKGLGRVSAVAEETILSRLGRTFGAWWKIRKAPEATLPGVWRLLGAIGEGVRYGEVISKLPPSLQALVERLVDVRWLTLGDDGILRGPAGKVALPKVKEALTANNVRRLRNIFNNVQGGEAQLQARKIIESDPNFDSFIADIRDPSSPGLDLVAKMKDGTYQIGEVKRQSSPVGPNNVYKVLRYTPGKSGQPGKPQVLVQALIEEIQKRVLDPFESDSIVEALMRRDGSVTLRVELVDTKATSSLMGLHGQVVDGVKIIINPPPIGR